MQPRPKSRYRVAVFSAGAGVLFALSTPALADNAIAMEREIEMVGPMLDYAASETGEAQLTIDLCTTPGTVSGSGSLRLEGLGHRSAVELEETAAGPVRVDGLVYCTPEPELSVEWTETWNTTQVATWPGGSRTFHVDWQDTFPLSFPLQSGRVELTPEQVVTYPRTTIDTTTSETALEADICVRLCDPSRLVDELREHLVLALGWQRALFEADIEIRQDEPLTVYQSEIEAWIEGTGLDAGMGFAPPPDREAGEGAVPQGDDPAAADVLTPEEVEGATGVLARLRHGPLARQLRVNPASCAVERLAEGGGWAEAVFPMAQDCALHSVASERVLRQRAECLVARGCEPGAETTPMGGVTMCRIPDGYEQILRRDPLMPALRQAAAHCRSAERILWWLEQHAACNPLAIDVAELGRQVEAYCAANIGLSQDASGPHSCADRCGILDTEDMDSVACWIACQVDGYPEVDAGGATPAGQTCLDLCTDLYETDLGIAICTAECRMEGMRSDAEDAASALQSAMDKQEDAFDMLSDILRALRDQQMSAMRNIR